MDFDTYLVKYTLDQLATDSNPILLLTKKKVNRIIKNFITGKMLTVEITGTKGNPTIYKVTKMKDLYEEHKGNECDTQRERIENAKGTNKPSNINTLKGIEEHKGNELGTQKERIRNTKVTPINDIDKDKDIYIVQAEELWCLYPNKKGKGKVINKIPKLIKAEGIKQMKICIERYKDELKKERKTFPTKSYQNGSTFFNSGYIDFLDRNYIVTNNKKVKAPITMVQGGFL